MRNFLATLCAIFLLAISTTASAVPITGLFNTGVDGSGNAWGAGGVSDIHYNAVLIPSPVFTPVTVTDSAFPFPPWVPNNANSRWIGPRANSQGPAGNYIYRTTFNLPANANLSTAMLGGLWGTDDWSNDIYLNGTLNPNVSAGFTSLVPFMVTAGFQTGLNSLEFRLTNAGGPTGLRVDRIAGKYDLIPEPGTCALAAIGLGGMLVRRRT